MFIGIAEYTLNLDFPEQNGNGIMAFQAKQVTVGKQERLNVIYVYKPVFDVQDTVGDFKVTATLLDDGSGIIVREPCIPSYMIHLSKRMHKLEGKEADDEVNLAAFKTHGIVSAAIKKDFKRRTRTTVYRFPNKIRCTLDYFNKRDNNKVESNLRLLPDLQSIKNYTTFNGFIIWKMAVVDSIESWEDGNEVDADSDIAKAINRLSNLNFDD